MSWKREKKEMKKKNEKKEKRQMRKNAMKMKRQNGTECSQLAGEGQQLMVKQSQKQANG